MKTKTQRIVPVNAELEIKVGTTTLFYDSQLGVCRGSVYTSQESPKVVCASPVVWNRAIRRKILDGARIVKK